MWMAAIVISGERVSRRSLDPAPEDPADLAVWYAGNLDRTLAVLRVADPDALTWTFSSTGDRRVNWWCRRLAIEVAIHRWDAQHALAAESKQTWLEPASRSSWSNSSLVSWPKRALRASPAPSTSMPQTSRWSGGSTSTPVVQCFPFMPKPIPLLAVRVRTSSSG